MVRFSANDAKLLSKSPVNTFLLLASDEPKIRKQTRLILNYFINKFKILNKCQSECNEK